ncbi:MAG: four helix bundle protein [Panacibacter sp.]
MATAQKFEDLEIWQLARALALSIFRLTKENEKLLKDYKLKDQMNASAGSVMDNIAEGFGRGSRLEFIQFLSIANGSADELKSQLYRCLDRNYITQNELDELYELADKVFRKNQSMINYLNQTNVKGQKFKNRTVTNDKRSTKND